MPERDVAGGERRAVRGSQIRGVENRSHGVGEGALAAGFLGLLRALEGRLQRCSALAFAHAVQAQFFAARRVDSIAAPLPLDDTVARLGAAHAGHGREERILQRVGRFVVHDGQSGQQVLLDPGGDSGGVATSGVVDRREPRDEAIGVSARQAARSHDAIDDADRRLEERQGERS